MIRKRIIVITLITTIILSIISYAEEGEEITEEEGKVYPIILEDPICEEGSREGRT